MDEWDYDNDGEFDESHGFNYADCSQNPTVHGLCFVGYADEEWMKKKLELTTVHHSWQNSAGFSIFNNSSLDNFRLWNGTWTQMKCTSLITLRRPCQVNANLGRLRNQSEGNEDRM